MGLSKTLNFLADVCLCFLLFSCNWKVIWICVCVCVLYLEGLEVLCQSIMLVQDEIWSWMRNSSEIEGSDHYFQCLLLPKFLRCYHVTI